MLVTFIYSAAATKSIIKCTKWLTIDAVLEWLTHYEYHTLPIVWNTRPKNLASNAPKLIESKCEYIFDKYRAILAKFDLKKQTHAFADSVNHAIQNWHRHRRWRADVGSGARFPGAIPPAAAFDSHTKRVFSAVFPWQRRFNEILSPVAIIPLHLNQL